MITDVAIEVFNWTPLAQLGVLVLIDRGRRGLPTAFWIVSAGFLVSFAANTAGRVTEIPYVTEHYYPALQLGLFAYAFGLRWAPLVLIAFAMAIPVTGGPEAAVGVLGAAIVLLWGRGPLKPSMWAFCGAANAFYFAFFFVGGAPLKWMYHLAEFLGVGLFIHAAYKWREAT